MIINLLASDYNPDSNDDMILDPVEVPVVPTTTQVSVTKESNNTPSKHAEKQPDIVKEPEKVENTSIEEKKEQEITGNVINIFYFYY